VLKSTVQCGDDVRLVAGVSMGAGADEGAADRVGAGAGPGDGDGTGVGAGGGAVGVWVEPDEEPAGDGAAASTRGAPGAVGTAAVVDADGSAKGTGGEDSSLLHAQARTRSRTDVKAERRLERTKVN
jgi:hypothetical protein